MPDPLFDLKKFTDTEWLILDYRSGPNVARQTVACLYELDPAEVGALGLRDLALAVRYTGPSHVLKDVREFYLQERSQRPIPIPASRR